MPGAVYFDLALWFSLENNIADNVALVCYGLGALLRRLAHSVTTYTLGIAMLIIATIPPRLAYFLFSLYFYLMWIFTIFPLGLFGPVLIIALPILAVYHIRDTVRFVVRYFLDHYIDKSTRQLVGAINGPDNEPIYGRAAMCSSNRQFRILTLRAGCFSSPVECRLSVASLGVEEDVDFEALSYVWGAELFGKRISVDGVPAVVKPNLFAALRHLRHQDRDRRLWVDALCIDQTTDTERASQVAQMGEIFRSARRVVVWLGTGSPTARVLFRKTSASESSAKGVHFGSVRAVSKLLSVPWWTRIWVVQEVSLAKDVIVQSGPENITWERFCAVVDHVLQHKIFENANRSLYVAEYQSLKALREGTSSGNLLERRPASNNLLRLSYDFRRREATIPADKLFALYGLAQGEADPLALDLRPPITYSNERSAVEWGTSEEFAARCIERFQDLSIFAMSEAFREYGLGSKADRPAWCPLWSSTPNDFRTTPFWLGCAGDATLRWQRRFSASGGLSAPPCRLQGAQDPLMSNKIRVRGWLVDTIDRVGVTSSSSLLAMTMNGFNGVSYKNIVDVIRSRVQWRSVLPQWKGMAVSACANKDEALRRYNRTITAGLFDSIPEREGGAYWEVVNQVCPGKCFFVTRSGLFGLATASVVPGQEMWALMGSAVPMILKVRIGSNGPVKTNGYGFDRSLNEAGSIDAEFVLREYICQAYVDDRMEYSGNVKDDLNSGKIVAEDVYLS